MKLESFGMIAEKHGNVYKSIGDSNLESTVAITGCDIITSSPFEYISYTDSNGDSVKFESCPIMGTGIEVVEDGVEIRFRLRHSDKWTYTVEETSKEGGS